MIKRRIITTFFLSLAVIGLHYNAMAWGLTGHRTVGYLAEQHLSKKAKKKIAKILNTETLAMASTWADFIKSDPDYDHTHKWHYLNMPAGEQYKEGYGPEEHLVKEIQRLSDVLKSSDTSNEDKVFALRFITHLVGDLHQPMHLGQEEDLGGNRVQMKWFGRKSNLHRIWDSEIIDSQKLSYTELGNSVNHLSKEQIKELQKQPLEQWVNDSKAICDELYASSKEDLSTYNYIYRYYPVVQQQLLVGGIHLAGLLNEIFE